MQKRYLALTDIEAYKSTLSLSNYVWKIVDKWPYFTKNTIGKQFVNAVDSISANVAEGFGRYGKKDKIKFYYYSRGSAKEASDWNEKANARGLLTQEEYIFINNVLQETPKKLHSLIRFTKDRLVT